MYNFGFKRTSTVLILALLAAIGLMIYSIASGNSRKTDDSDTPAPTQSAQAALPNMPAISLKVVKNAQNASFMANSDTPSVMIYQTHTEEAYTMQSGAEYVEASKWRTADSANNVVRVGEILAYFLQNKYGWSILHDSTDYEPPKLGTAYERSLEGMQQTLDKNPQIKLFIDVHRDAYNTNNKPKFVEIDGKEVARVMFVVGKGIHYSSATPWESNYEVAEAIAEKLNAVDSRLCRGVSIHDNRYNQHMGENCLLIEVGHNENTLEQALNAIPYVAEAINEVLGERYGSQR